MIHDEEFQSLQDMVTTHDQEISQLFHTIRELGSQVTQLVELMEKQTKATKK